jgi:hypothetical protein
VRAAVDVPLFVKLPGQASDVVALARAARSADRVAALYRPLVDVVGPVVPAELASELTRGVDDDA